MIWLTTKARFQPYQIEVAMNCINAWMLTVLCTQLGVVFFAYLDVYGSINGFRYFAVVEEWWFLHSTSAYFDCLFGHEAKEWGRLTSILALL